MDRPSWRIERSSSKCVEFFFRPFSWRLGVLAISRSPELPPVL